MKTLHHPDFEKDSCGFGLIARLDDEATHDTVADAVKALVRLTHRGAVAPDGKTGDGCGLLLKMPTEFLRAVATEAGLQPARRFAVGSVFLADNDERAADQQALLDAEIEARGLAVAGWRRVPVEPDACGDSARATLPRIEQVFVNAPDDMDADDFERRLFLARRRCEQSRGDRPEYIASLSARTISYKGMVMPEYLARFYPDLADERLSSAREEAQALAQTIRREMARRGLDETDLIGPAPPFFDRLRDRYRWQIIVRAADPPDLLRGIDIPPGWRVDVDPTDVL